MFADTVKQTYCITQSFGECGKSDEIKYSLHLVSQEYLVNTTRKKDVQKFSRREH